MNRRRYEQQLQNNRETAHITDVRKMLIRAILVILYFLICYYIPPIAGA